MTDIYIMDYNGIFLEHNFRVIYHVKELDIVIVDLSRDKENKVFLHAINGARKGLKEFKERSVDKYGYAEFTKIGEL